MILDKFNVTLLSGYLMCLKRDQAKPAEGGAVGRVDLRIDELGSELDTSPLVPLVVVPYRNLPDPFAQEWRHAANCVTVRSVIRVDQRESRQKSHNVLILVIDVSFPDIAFGKVANLVIHTVNETVPPRVAVIAHLVIPGERYVVRPPAHLPGGIVVRGDGSFRWNGMIPHIESSEVSERLAHTELQLGPDRRVGILHRGDGIKVRERRHVVR